MTNLSTPMTTNFIILWILACAIGSAMGAPIGVAVGENIGFPVGTFIALTFRIPSELMNTVTSAFAGLLNGSISSVILGICQSLVLARYIKHAIWWIPASVFGVAVGSAVNSAIVGLIGAMFGDAYNPFVLLLCGGLVMSPFIGVIGALPQWLILRRQISNSHWWIWTQAVTGTVIAILEIFGAIISFAFPGLWRLLCMAGFSLITGGLFGLATGIVLYQLIKRAQNNLVNAPAIT
jgi:hypothetical protein